MTRRFMFDFTTKVMDLLGKGYRRKRGETDGGAFELILGSESA
jgi:hypothetical protein